MFITSWQSYRWFWGFCWGFCWGFWQWHSNLEKLAQAQGICIQIALTHLNIHPEQCRLVRTVRVCYAKGTECTWHCVFIRSQPLSEGSLILLLFLTSHPFIFALSCSFSTHCDTIKASYLTVTPLTLFAHLVKLNLIQNVISLQPGIAFDTHFCTKS